LAGHQDEGRIGFNAEATLPIFHPSHCGLWRQSQGMRLYYPDTSCFLPSEMGTIPVCVRVQPCCQTISRSELSDIQDSIGVRAVSGFQIFVSVTELPILQRLARTSREFADTSYAVEHMAPQVGSA
jgi:hypothetical protein